ncbi:MAG: hypothetical protein OXM61_23525, partial [Candidatus Poribacteria bacterium]|nr:hypothetical protein [Candidatus Poribacteria bacterium]
SIVALQSLICKRRKEGPSTWTEYRVFTVEQAMVKVLPVKDLISRTHAGLDDLKEYNERRSDIEEKRYFEDQAERINQAIDEVEKSEETKDNLRAELRMLLEIVAYYDKNWAIGSEILRELLIAIAFTVPIFLFIGIAPTVLPSQDSSGSALGFVNWAFFGVAGSLTAVLRKLYLGSKVEVGLTEGKNELYQALKGAILGLVSGVMVYAMLKGGFVENGKIVPDVYSNDPKDIGLSIFWAFITGFMFENFFDKAVREHSQSNG